MVSAKLTIDCGHIRCNGDAYVAVQLEVESSGEARVMLFAKDAYSRRDPALVRMTLSEWESLKQALWAAQNALDEGIKAGRIRALAP